MRSWFKVVSLLALVVLVAGVVIGCGGGGSGPEDTVRNAFKAMEAKDAEKMASYCTEDIFQEELASLESMFDMIDSIKIKNLKTTVASQTSNTATVDYTCDWEIKMWGETTTEPDSDSVDLVKVDGKWLISEPMDEEE